MKQNTLILASLVSAVLALSACGGGSSDGPELTAAPVEPAIAKTTPAAEEPTRSPRGNIIKTVGEPGGIRLEDGSDQWALNFTVTGIEVDPACPSVHAGPGDNGHLVAVSVEATTAAEPAFSEALQTTGISFDPHYWKAIAANGTTVNTVSSQSASNCFTAAEIIPNTIGAAEKVVGKIVLDVPDVTGTLVYSLGGGGTGWEWEYGTK